MAEADRPTADSSGAITVMLRGYFSQHNANRRAVALPLAQAATPRAVLALLSVPAGGVGLLLVNRQQVSMDSPLRAGDTLEILPLLGGGRGEGETLRCRERVALCLPHRVSRILQRVSRSAYRASHTGGSS